MSMLGEVIVTRTSTWSDSDQWAVGSFRFRMVDATCSWIDTPGVPEMVKDVQFSGAHLDHPEEQVSGPRNHLPSQQGPCY